MVRYWLEQPCIWVALSFLREAGVTLGMLPGAGRGHVKFVEVFRDHV